MTIRASVFLSRLAVLLIWLAVFLWFLPNHRQWWFFLCAFAGLVLSTMLVVSMFRCPHCGARFGYYSFVRGNLALPWLWRECSNCGGDLDKPST